MLLGFAAVCTAGILYPLHWIMGIRLNKEDELQGLDAAGKLNLLYKK
jgi:ammonia channel protein AmtB